MFNNSTPMEQKYSDLYSDCRKYVPTNILKTNPTPTDIENMKTDLSALEFDAYLEIVLPELQDIFDKCLKDEFEELCKNYFALFEFYSNFQIFEENDFAIDTKTLKYNMNNSTDNAEKIFIFESFSKDHKTLLEFCEKFTNEQNIQASKIEEECGDLKHGWLSYMNKKWIEQEEKERKEKEEKRKKEIEQKEKEEQLQSELLEMMERQYQKQKEEKLQLEFIEMLERQEQEQFQEQKKQIEEDEEYAKAISLSYETIPEVPCVDEKCSISNSSIIAEEKFLSPVSFFESEPKTKKSRPLPQLPINKQIPPRFSVNQSSEGIIKKIIEMPVLKIVELPKETAPVGIFDNPRFKKMMEQKKEEEKEEKDWIITNKKCTTEDSIGKMIRENHEKKQKNIEIANMNRETISANSIKNSPMLDSIDTINARRN
jgi:hypothetical protein